MIAPIAFYLEADFETSNEEKGNGEEIKDGYTQLKSKGYFADFERFKLFGQTPAGSKR